MGPKQRYYENVAKTIIEHLENRQMKGFDCRDSIDAIDKVRSLIPEGSSVSWGGSVTLQETGIMDTLIDGEYEVLDRDMAVTREQQKEIYGRISVCDWFLTSSNAITLDGELVNVDNRGNRVSYLCFGPDNVIVVVGINKIVANVDEGISRARNIAAPPNVLRLGRNTPCAVTGKCENCLSPDCICAQTVITRRSTYPGRINVIIVGEELGY